MKKKEMVDDIATGTGLPKTTINKTFDAVVDSIKTAIREDGRLQIAGLGTFKVKIRPARKRVHPLTKEVITCPSYKTVTFTPTPLFKESIQ